MNDLWKPNDITNESETIKQIDSLVPKLVLMNDFQIYLHLGFKHIIDLRGSDHYPLIAKFD